MTVALACPDWRALAHARDTTPGDPPGWEDALRHLDGCASCRRAAVVADPTLAFRNLPAIASGDDEVEAMRLRVATLRGLSTTPARRRLPVWRLAAAAVVALAVLAGGNGPREAVTSASLAARPAAAPARAAVPAALADELASEPLLEGIDRPVDHVVQWNGDDLSVILVVDQRLGV